LLGITVEGLAVYLLLERCITPLTHANLKIPQSVDKWLGQVLVFPSFHRVHHSAYQPETDSNYSLAFPWWDKLFGTYTRQPSLPHEQMTFGLTQYNSDREQKILGALSNPFRN
jgi:sterol desaturase/sphingolipid hydroxylase (fatty acid hydroxylase superfamily)